ncbi:hypothetical protein MTO96_015170 [Rhipicephalus appendiculatus]
MGLWFTVAFIAFALTLLIRFYNGDVPFLLIKDLDFLEYAYIKNFQNFTARGMVPHIAESAEVFMDMLELYADSGEGESTTTMGNAMKPFYWFLGQFGSLTFKVFSKETTKMIEQRKSHPELRKPDILQNLLDAEIEEEALSEVVNKSEAQQTADGVKKRVRALSPREVIMNATLLFMGGFETTSIAMCYLTFLLAKHQDVQDKLREEVKEAVSESESGIIDYEMLTKKLKYLIQVVEEGLRLYPPAVVATSRQADEDFEWNGMKFKAGTCIMSPTYQLHRDPRYWVDPDTFDPERFSPENESSIYKMAFQPFGVGPRHCVGFQMARLELRYTLARLVQRYRVELGESQKGEMKMGGYAMISAPDNGPWLKFYKL